MKTKCIDGAILLKKMTNIIKILMDKTENEIFKTWALIWLKDPASEKAWKDGVEAKKEFYRNRGDKLFNYGYYPTYDQTPENGYKNYDFEKNKHFGADYAIPVTISFAIMFSQGSYMQGSPAIDRSMAICGEDNPLIVHELEQYVIGL